MSLTDDQIDRYARQLILKEIGGPGQQKLLKARVLIVGAGGLGSPLALYLAAAGVGTIGIVDDDQVALSNLQRQILYTPEDVGRPKTERAAARLKQFNPDITVETHALRLTAQNACDLIAGYDIVADGSDSFTTRFAVNEAAFRTKRTLVSAAVVKFDGQLATFKAHERSGPTRLPCYRCLVPELPDNPDTDTCESVGILGAAAGAMGALQAVEVIKELLGVGESMAGRLMIQDFLSGTVRTLRLPADPACPVCGDGAPAAQASVPGTPSP